MKLKIEITKKDIKFIEEQLGRPPRGIIEISARCKSGHPLVVKTNPKINDEIFPTLYYLVCDKIINKVSLLESQGFIEKLQNKIDNDEALKIKFLLSQASYRQERNKLIGDLGKLSQSQRKSLESGIGGVDRLDRVKCLHCHLAHYLAKKNNPIGAKVAKMVGESC